MLTELFLGVGYKPFAGVCHIDDILPFLVLLYLIDDDKVILIPMDNARHWSFFGQHFKTQPSPKRLETYGFCRLADT